MKTIFSALIFLPAVIFAGTVSHNRFAPLLREGEASHSSAVLIMKNGKVVFSYYSVPADTEIESMSVTKSVVSLALAQLLSEGKIKSLDMRLSEYFPCWRQGMKETITLREVMDQTSGLENVPNTQVEIYPSRNFVKLALCAELSSEPGMKFAYNNKALNLLPAVVKKVTGLPLDTFLRNGIFKALGITRFKWLHDPAGNPEGMAGFEPQPIELAKIGELVLDKGRWHGRQLIESRWIDSLFVRSQPYRQNYGLLWWRVPDSVEYVIDSSVIAGLDKSGAKPGLIEKLRKIEGKYTTEPGYFDALKGEFGAKAGSMFNMDALGFSSSSLSRKVYGSFVGDEAFGYLGQYLVIFPAENVVAVRLIKWSPSYNGNTDGFYDFPQVVYRIISHYQGRLSRRKH